MIKTKKNRFMILVCFLFLGFVVIYSYFTTTSQILEVGVFVGSNWNVANANSYTIMDKATFANPHQFPDGIEYVFVNGVLTLANGKGTGALGGVLL